MAAESITVFIDPTQLAAQKNNNYSLFLAKMVNGQFTVIWQSKGPLGGGSYEYQNNFTITVPSYGVNYGTVTTNSGSVTFEAGGLAQSIDIGQTVELDKQGIFGPPTNSGAAGEITIANQLAGNPHAILLDDHGNVIFVNTQSGMDIGPATLTPIDTYQIWFDNLQETGTIIAHNASNVATVTFSGGTTNQVISYNAAGAWESGPPAETVDMTAVSGDPISVTVLATFKYALSAGVVTYLLSKLIDKFSSGLRPTKIQAQAGSSLLSIEFGGAETHAIAAAFGLDKFGTAVNLALTKAKADSASGLKNETWTVREPTVTTSY